MHIKTVYFIQLMGKKESVYPKSIIYIARTCKTTSLKIAKNLNSNCFSKKKSQAELMLQYRMSIYKPYFTNSGEG